MVETLEKAGAKDPRHSMLTGESLNRNNPTQVVDVPVIKQVTVPTTQTIEKIVEVSLG